ncbi:MULTISPECIES: acyl-CoA dehydrogenase family protein [unclassified Mesorhizobium]|uniref:acyl-CoA dehydrogenase family protein n=1 Tax=unclassified Mesorhizobium TaxID=325217 RepID=UPI0033389C9F
MIKRSLFSHTDDRFRLYVADFLDSEIAPYHGDWEMQGRIPRDAWLKAGAAGLLCRTAPSGHGGCDAPFTEAVVIAEELAKRRLSGFLTFLQSDIVAPYFLKLATENQKQDYVPGLCSGAKLGAIAMTEPQSGSEVAHMKTSVARIDGDFAINGEKKHISNGFSADVIVVAARKAGLALEQAPQLSLLIVDADRQGLSREPIAKSGMRALDTSTIVFDDCRVGGDKLLGAEGRGLFYLLTFLGLERLMLAIYAQTNAVTILQELIGFCGRRKTSRGSLLDYQVNYCRLADLYGECTVNQAYIDACIIEQSRSGLNPRAASLAKLRATETLKSVAALSVQLHGAQGISGVSGERCTQDLLDSAVQSIWGGASEVLRDVIGRGLVNSL